MSWTAPANNGASITDYDVQYRACTLSTDLTCSDSNTATWESTWTDRTGETNSDTTRSVTLSGLTNGTAYQVQVRAANSVGESTWSTSASEYPSTVPGKPAAPTLAVKDVSLGVSWSAPAGDGGAAITGYKVGRCSASCSNDAGWTVKTLTETGTTTDLTGLTNGTAYQVRVAAVNRSGDSAWSDTTTETPADEPDAPAAPTVTVWNQQLTVSWTAPADNGASITDYDVQYRACTATDGDTAVLTCANNPTWGAWTDRTGETNSDTTTSVTLSSLTNDTAYQVQVRAANSVGESSWSTATKATPTAQKPDVPAAPSLTYGDGSLGVTWTAPADNGASISDYDVQYRACTLSTDLTCSDSNTATWESTWTDRTGETTSDTTRSATLSSLTNGTAYQVQVRAGNSVGESEWSTSGSEYPSTVPGKPAAPTLSVKDQGLGVSWSAPSSTGGAAITGYKVGRCSANCSNDANWTVKTLTTTGTTTDLTSLTNGTAYQVRVAAVNRSGDSAWSDTATETPADEPDTPAAPTVTVWNQQLTVSWTAPADNGASITDYDVQYRACTLLTDLTCSDSNTATWGSWTARTGETTSDTTTSVTLSGLTNDTAYQVQVRGANSVGESSWSTATKATPTAQKPDQPGAPTLTHGNASLSVSWSAPANNGASISDYDVQYRACTYSTDLTCADSSTATWESTWTDRTGETNSDTTTSTTLGSLTNGTAYQVQVRAANSVGESDWSTSASEYPSTTPGKPAAPTLSVKDQSLGVSWSAPSSTGGAAITGYKVGRCSTNCSNDANWTVKTLTTAGTTTDLTSLTNGTAYQVRVAAVNRSGDSAWSDTATETPADEPDAPGAPTVTVWNQQLTVSWTAPTDNGATISDYDVQYRACTLSTDLTCSDSNTATWGSWTDRTGETNSDTSTSVTIDSLTNDTAYQVQVRAANSVGESTWSTATKATPTAQKPDKPAAPSLTYGDTSLTVSWTAPANNGASISDYDVQYRACTLSTDLTCADSNTATWASSWTARTGETTSDTTTSATLSSLTNGTAYQVQVRAANSVGESEWSTSADEYPSTVPGKPAAPTLTVKDQSLGVSWSAPSSDGGAAITGYKVGRCSSSCSSDASWTVKTLTTTGNTTDLTSLTNGTAYQVRVAAVNRSGDSAWSDTATETPADEPDAPAAPTVTVWNQQLTVSWTAPTDNGATITDYDVQYRACTLSTDLTCSDSNTATWESTWTDRTGETNSDTSTSVTLSSLTNDTAYQVQVRAANSVGESTWSTATKATPTAQKPDKPAAPSLTYGDTSLTVSWTAPADNGASISDYDVQYRACTYSTDLTCADSSTATWASSWTARTGETTSDTTTSATLSGLTNGTAYQVQVRAANSVGESEWSTSADEYPSTVPGKPAAPTLTVKDQSLGVSWSAPSSNGGAAVTGYKVGRCSTGCDSSSNWTVKTLTGTGTTTDLTSLTNGTAYQVRVAAVNRSGDSAWSDTTTATPAKAPDAPSAPTLTKGPRELSVSWSAPPDNGASITDYDVRYCVNSTGCDAADEWTSLSGAADPGTSTSATISSLTNGTTYQVQVRGTNSVGDGSWSLSSSAAPEDKPAQPAAPTLTYSNTSLSVSWTAPADNGQEITDYDVQYRACSLSTDLTCSNPSTATWGTWTDRTGETTSDTTASATLSSLTNGTTYQVQVRAANSVGESDWSTSADEYPSTTPGRPDVATLTVKDVSLGVSWSAPSGNGGAAITGYKVGRCSTGCGTDSNWTVKTLTGTGTTTDVTGLTNGTAYQVRVAAVNRSGAGSWSGAATATPAKAPDAPGAPTLTLRHQALKVSWTAPADNGEDITDYDVQYRACTATDGDIAVLTCATNPTWGAWTDRSGETNSDTATAVTITGLTNGTAYQVQVRATNSVGDGVWSASTSGVPATQAPDPPAAPKVTARHQGLAVSWTAPSSAGSAITDYDVRYCNTRDGCESAIDWAEIDDTGQNAANTATTATITGLTNGQTYEVQVRATNGIGDSTWSDSTEGTPAIQPPDGPAAPTLTHKNRSLDVSWTAPANNGASITDYDVQHRACTLATDLTCSDTSTATWGAWTDRTGETTSDTTTSVTLSSLTNGTAYQVQVRAANSEGEGAWSQSATETPSTKPERPVAALNGLAGSPTVSRVSWTVDDGGSPITGLEVRYRCFPGAGWATWTVAAGTTSRNSSIPECASKLSTTEYRFQVRAQNANGWSAWSYPFVKTTAPSFGASAITIGPASTQMTVSWTATDGGLEISDHDVRYRQKDTNTGTPGDQPGSWITLTSTADPGTNTTATITGLTVGATYQVQVRATNARGLGSWSDSVDWPLPPTAPAPTVTARHLGLEVSWTAPASNGATITDYDVQYRKCTASADECGRNPIWETTWTSLSHTGTGTTATITGLTNGIPYQVQVRATNIVGESAWSASVEAIPANQPPDAPAAPTLTVPSQTSLGVSWTEPATNGQPITDYDVQYRACTLATDLACSNTSTATWGTWTDRTGETGSDTTTTATITGLTKATAYQVRVRAANTIGEGGWSDSTTGIPAAVPGAPAAATLTVKHQSLDVSWSAPTDDGGSAVTDYDVQYRACTATDSDTAVLTCATNPTWGSWTTLSGADDPGTSTSASITGLTNDTAYQVQVRASNPAGPGTWSASASATPTPQKPDAPAAPTVTARHQGLAVSWTAPAANGHAISDYDVQYRACTATPKSCATNATWGSWTTLTGNADPGSSTTAAITGLTNATAYQVQVRAANTLGTGAWSASGTGTPAPQPPDPPAAPTTRYGDKSLTASWSRPNLNGSTLQRYEARIRIKDTNQTQPGDQPGAWITRFPGKALQMTFPNRINGTTYQVQVQAVSDLGASGWSLSGEGTPAPKPAAPATPTVVRGDRSLDVSWTAPSGPVEDYDVQYRACTLATDLTCSNSSNATWGAWTDRTGETNADTATSVTVTGLTNGTAYQVQVRATNHSGTSGWSTHSTAATPAAKPSAPAAPTLSVGDQSLGVSWTAPADNGEAITDYDVQYRACTLATDLTCSNSSNATWGAWTDRTGETNSDTATSVTVTGLTNGTAYQVQVRATNAVADGDWSPSAAATPATKPNSPAAPTVNSWHVSLRVSWTAPADNGAPITDYDVQYRACTATPKTCATSPTWGSWAEWNASNTSTTTSATITGLTNDTAYEVQVRAANSRGESDWSTATKQTPETQKPDAPGAPTVNSWHAGLRVSWTAPADNGETITDYDVQYRACTATPLSCATSPTWGSWTEWNASDTSTTTSATITGLTNGTTYQIQVRAANSRGDGPWSLSTNGAPAAQKPGKPGAPTLTHKHQSLDVSWTAPAANGEAITGYRVRHCDNSKDCSADSANWTPKDLTGTGTSTTITGLTNGTTYQVQVRATNSVGNGQFSASATEYPSTVPSSPAAPTLTFKDQALDVSWSAPSSNGGSAVTGYKVGRCSASCDNDSSWTVTTLTGTGTTTTLSGLTNGTAYQVRVAATNRSGDSSWSSSASETPAKKPAKPAKPTVTRGNQRLTVEWTAPDDGGDTISDYDVNYREYKPDNTYGPTKDHPFSGNGTTTTITGLGNGKRYEVTVRATNKAGNSDWSPWSDRVTPATVPSAPSAPTLTYGNTSLGVSWTAPADNGDDISDYDVQYRACTLSTDLTCSNSSTATWGAWTEWNSSDTSTTTSATITGLTNGTAYQVQVRAANGVGDGSWSASAKENPSTVPGAPAAPTLTSKNESLEVTWAFPSDKGGSAITGSKFRTRACTATPKSCTTNPAWGDWSYTFNYHTSTTQTLPWLTNGTAYQVAVQAKNRSGYGAWSSSSTATPAQQKPDAPTAPTLTVKDRALGVSWTAPANNGANITDYDVQYRACTLSTDLTCSTSSIATWGSWQSKSFTGTGTSTTISSLTNGTAYQVQVQATNSVGDSPWSPSAKATPAAKPSTPAQPTVTAGAQQLAVSWTAPSDGGSAITGYKVRHCDQSTGCDADDEWTTVTLTGTGTSTTISNLTNGTTYRVQVAATNSRGDSAWSSYRTGKPRDKPATPDAPTLISGNNSLTVKWTAPADNGSAITGYKVRHCDTNDETKDCYGSYDDWTTKNVTSTSTTISGVTNGHTIQVEVQARNAAGDSSWSSTSEGVPGAPAAPSKPTLTAGDQQMVVSWSAPSNRGSAITGYDVYYCDNSDASSPCTDDSNWTDAYHSDTTTSTTITGLTNGTEYKVRVRAENDRGAGGWSPEATATPATLPDAPDAPSLKVKSGALDVSWTAPSGNGGAAITGYKVRHCDNSTGCDATNEWTTKNVSGGSTTTTTISSLTNGKTYQVQVAAVNRVGAGTWSASTTATPAALPSKPATPTVDIKHQGLVVSWTAPSGNGSVISGYDVHYRKQNSDNTWPTDWTSHTHSDTTTGTSIDSLTNGSKYQVRVRANSNNGDSPWSNTVTATPKAVPDAPDQPTLTAGDQKLDVSWAAPANNNGSAVTDYDVEYRKRKSDNTWPTSWTSKSHTGTTTSTSITGLTNGGTYQVRVRAANANGKGPWSTPASDTPAGKPAKPSAPTVTAGDSQLTVTWTAPSDNGSAITQYDVYYCDNTDTSSPCSDDDNWSDSGHSDTTLTIDITGLTNGTAYKVRVRAVNDNGDGPWSNSTTATPAGKPSAPDNLEFVSGGGYLTISWNTTSNGSTISGHQIRYCNTNDSDKDCSSDYDDWTTVSVSGTTTSKKITGLTNGDNYEMQVRANSNQGYSDWSFSNTGMPGAPAKPTLGTLTAGDDQFTANWTAGSSNGDPITYFEVSYCNETNSDCASGIWNTESQWDPSILSLTISYLEDATKYKVRVRAANGRGEGEWSAIKTVTTT